MTKRHQHLSETYLKFGRKDCNRTDYATRLKRKNQKYNELHATPLEKAEAAIKKTKFNILRQFVRESYSAGNITEVRRILNENREVFD